MKVAVTAGEASLDAAVDPRFGRCPYFLLVETDDLTFEAVENPNLMLGGGAGIQSAQLMSEKGVGFVLTGNCGPNAYRTLSAAGIEIVTGCSGTVREAVAQFQAGGLSGTAGPNVAGHFGMGPPPPPDQTAAPATSPAAEPDRPGSVAPDAANPEGLGSGAGGMGSGMGQRGGGGSGGGMGPGMGQGMGSGMGPGMGQGIGGGMGGGMGRGMGRGRGGGMGRGMGQGMGRGQGQGMGQGQGRGVGQGPGQAMGRGAPFATGQPTPPETPAGPTRADELSMLKQQAEQLGYQMQDILERIRRLEEGR